MRQAHLMMALLGLALGWNLEAQTSDIDQLAQWLSGEFSSKAQALEDPDNYFHIHLVAVPIWEGRDDGPWLYVEQAAAGSLDRPYRQRVYHLQADGEEIQSQISELPGDPLEWAGAWRDPARFDSLVPEQLVPRSGCAVVMRRTGPDSFEGSTGERTCSSDHRGSSYATSVARVTASGMTSWDRGFDDEGRQVWGAARGPYRFDRIDQK